MACSTILSIRSRSTRRTGRIDIIRKRRDDIVYRTRLWSHVCENTCVLYRVHYKNTTTLHCGTPPNVIRIVHVCLTQLRFGLGL